MLIYVEEREREFIEEESGLLMRREPPLRFMYPPPAANSKICLDHGVRRFRFTVAMGR
jgi:hypothetical protein